MMSNNDPRILLIPFVDSFRSSDRDRPRKQPSFGVWHTRWLSAYRSYKSRDTARAVKQFSGRVGGLRTYPVLPRRITIRRIETSVPHELSVAENIYRRYVVSANAVRTPVASLIDSYEA